MKVAFLHAKQDPKYAHLMLRSVRQHMPWAECVMLTDKDTPAIEGCTVVRRPLKDENIQFFRMEHLSHMPGDILVLDTDVIVQADVSQIFAFDFDMALTWRDGPIYDKLMVDITKMMPVNCGVMFHRSTEFWKACLNWCEVDDPGWYADQLSIAAVMRKFNVLRLHCDNFNYTPRNERDDVSNRMIVHYKGNARVLMDKMIEEECHAGG